jgi:hypothetical protein
MATLHITEYRAGGIGGNHELDVPQAVPLAVQSVTFTGTAAASSNAIRADAEVVKIWADAACRIRFGATPVAAGTDDAIPANTVIWLQAPPSGTFKISAITIA